MLNKSLEMYPQVDHKRIVSEANRHHLYYLTNKQK